MTKTISQIQLPNHRALTVIVAPNGNLFLACVKCQGTGYIAGFAYHDEGVCYTCSGLGAKQNAKAFADEAAVLDWYTKSEKRRAARHAKEAAAREAAWEAGREAREADIAARAAAEEAARLEAEARLAASTYLEGEIGERVGFTGTVKLVKSIEGHYGHSLLVIVAVGTGEVKFFTTAKFAYDLEEGQEVSLTGEIAGWDTYGDVKQTSVKKAKVA